MKKSFILSALSILLALPALAQEIVSYDDPHYWFQSCCDHPPGEGFQSMGYMMGYEEAFQYKAVGSTTIHGLAIALRSIYVQRDINSHAKHQGAMVLYQGEPNTQLQLVAEVNITDEDYHTILDHSKRIVFTELGVSGFPDAEGYPRNDTLILVEFYFPRPVTMEGKFFAGFKSAYPQSNLPFLDPAPAVLTCPPCESGSVDSTWMMCRIYNDTGSFFWKAPSLPLYIPIMTAPEPDSGACPRPEADLDMMDTEAARGLATLGWQHMPPAGGKQQLALAPWPGEPDSALDLRTIYPGQPRFNTYTGLDTSVTYAVWLRDECCPHLNLHRDTTWWTDWSDPLIFTLADTTAPPDPIGILLPDAPGEVLSVEYYDLLGRPLSQPPARGLYIRRTTTTQGTTTRKIVRQ